MSLHLSIVKIHDQVNMTRRKGKCVCVFVCVRARVYLYMYVCEIVLMCSEPEFGKRSHPLLYSEFRLSV